MNDQPAFSKGIDTRTPIEWPPYVSIRCRVATACLQGFLAKEGPPRFGEIRSEYIKESIKYADELLKQLGEKE